jgi:glycosyltransferase involved in cell wall biosynthesis
MWFMQHLGHADHFTCPSRFMIDHYVRWGIGRDRISHVTNGQPSYAPTVPAKSAPGPHNRFGFFGQMIDVKGVHILLRAVDILRGQGFTDFRVELNGANIRFASDAVRQEIAAFLQAERALPAHERLVTDNGSYEISQVHTRMARVDWCIVPSIWWEIFGLVISEAWMFGKPVICSNVGGMAERVGDEVDGLHFEMGNPQALAQTIRRACTEDGLWQRLHAALPSPPSSAEMALGYRRLYDTPAPRRPARAA